MEAWQWLRFNLAVKSLVTLHKYKAEGRGGSHSQDAAQVSALQADDRPREVGQVFGRGKGGFHSDHTEADAEEPQVGLLGRQWAIHS